MRSNVLCKAVPRAGTCLSTGRKRAAKTAPASAPFVPQGPLKRLCPSAGESFPRGNRNPASEAGWLGAWKYNNYPNHWMHVQFGCRPPGFTRLTAAGRETVEPRRSAAYLILRQHLHLFLEICQPFSAFFCPSHLRGMCGTSSSTSHS